METYIILGKYTATGMARLKELPERLKNWEKTIEAMGGKWISYYLTVGHYDVVIIVQLPDRETLTTLLLAQGMLGNLQTETLMAFSQAETERLVANLP
jgi:uncharacterized protein with GYD domain